jgi:hypothetical protein
MTAPMVLPVFIFVSCTFYYLDCKDENKIYYFQIYLKKNPDIFVGNKVSMIVDPEFQTPPPVCKYMASMIPEGTVTVLEPSPGLGNIVHELVPYQITAAADFFLLDKITAVRCYCNESSFQ